MPTFASTANNQFETPRQPTMESTSRTVSLISRPMVIGVETCPRMPFAWMSVVGYDDTRSVPATR